MKCKRYNPNSDGGVNCPRDKKGTCLKYKRGEVSQHCDIKPKPRKTKTFKAWAHMWDDKIHCVQLRKQDFANLSLEPNAVVLPCVITIARKHLKK